MSYCIRRADFADYEGLCQLFAEGDLLHRQALPHVFQEPDGPVRTKGFVAAITSGENNAVFVAEADGQIVGLVCMLIREAPAIPIILPRRYAVVDNLVVTERYRRTGIGRALMQWAEQWAADKGATEVELNVWVFNRGAIALYEKLGYVTASQRMWKLLKEDPS